MYSNNTLNFQESTTILNASAKSLETYWSHLVPPCLTLSKVRYVSRVKWSNPGKGVAPPRLGVVAIEKGAFWSPSTTVANFTTFMAEKIFTQVFTHQGPILALVYPWHNQPIDIMVRVFTIGQGDLVRIILKTWKKWCLMPPCLTLSIIMYRSRVIEQSKERSSILAYTSL